MPAIGSRRSPNDAVSARRSWLLRISSRLSAALSVCTAGAASSHAWYEARTAASAESSVCPARSARSPGWLVAGAIAKNGGTATGHHVACTITADKGDAGIKIITSKLSVVVEGLSGIDKDKFVQIAKDAEKGCPVSNALRGSLEIVVDVTVK